MGRQAGSAESPLSVTFSHPAIVVCGMFGTPDRIVQYQAIYDVGFK